MFEDFERPDNFEKQAMVLECPVGDYVFGGFARSKTLGLTKQATESSAWRAIVDRARKDCLDHSRRVAALAGESECWIKVAGVWFSAVVQSVAGQTATLMTSCGDLHIVPVDEIAFERPCRWPV